MNSTRNRHKWQRVSREHRCPICDHADWCLFTGPAGSPDAAICARTPSQKRCGEAGWLHRLRDDWHERPRRRRRCVEAPADPAIALGTIGLDELARNWYLALGDHLRGLLSHGLGVSTDSLHRLRVGWSAGHRASTWPMVDASGAVRGIRLRAADGRKWSVRGGREGLFIPVNVPIGDVLVICEGATDCAALLDLHFDVVGRPSCDGGVRLLIDLVCTWQPNDVVIIADSDAPGQRGARSLAARLVGYVPAVRLVIPRSKDAREWVCSGADRLDVLDAIESAPTMTLSYARRPML
jgi:hypothetical protein